MVTLMFNSLVRSSIVALGFCCGISSIARPQDIAADSQAAAELLSCQRIWDASFHCAFTDLIRHHDQWICVFREGPGHVSPDGTLRVLSSPQGTVWTSIAELKMPGFDLRDPKLESTPSGKLMLIAAGAVHQPADYRHQTYAWLSSDGRAWSQPMPIGERDYWIWRTAWQNRRAVAIGYRTNQKTRGTRLYVSQSCIQFKVHVPELFMDGYPNESGIIFQPDKTCFVLLRRDPHRESDSDLQEGAKQGISVLGKAAPPYLDWQWQETGVRIGGPDLLQLPDGRIVAAGRLYDGQVRTSLCWLDPTDGQLDEFLTLPSGGDTSYPGLVWHDDALWVSYYSSHEANPKFKSAIYLAKVRIPSP